MAKNEFNLKILKTWLLRHRVARLPPFFSPSISRGWWGPGGVWPPSASDFHLHLPKKYLHELFVRHWLMTSQPHHQSPSSTTGVRRLPAAVREDRGRL